MATDRVESQFALLGESGQSVPNSNGDSKLRRAATVAMSLAAGIGIGCGVAVMQPNHTMEPTLLYGASPVTLQTPQCRTSEEIYAASGSVPLVSFAASGSIPFTSGGAISGPITVTASGADGKCVDSVFLDGTRIYGQTWFDKPCTAPVDYGQVLACTSQVQGTGHLTIGFQECEEQGWGKSGGKVHAQFSFKGATSWGYGPLAGTLTLSMESSDGFCSKGITVNGQLVNNEKIWFDKPCTPGEAAYDGCTSTKTIHLR